jgi:very-short-patch-repair endonuclease
VGSQSHLEGQLNRQLRASLMPQDHEQQFMFAKAIGRRWAADFCWPSQRLIVEVDGGTWTGGRHVTGSGYHKDLEKLNQGEFDKLGSSPL